MAFVLMGYGMVWRVGFCIKKNGVNPFDKNQFRALANGILRSKTTHQHCEKCNSCHKVK